MRRAIGTRRAAGWMVVGAAVVAALLGGGGCLQILGDDGTFVLGGAGGTGTTTGGTGGVGGTSGGTGGMTTTECDPGVSEACYDGPEGTKDAGICTSGTHECGADGTWGTCDGEVTPTAETCVTLTDEDCDEKECALWSSIVGGSPGAIPVTTQADSKGNLIVLGLFGGVLTIGDDVLDETVGGPIFLAKFDATGKPLWAENFGVDSQGTFAADSLELDSNDNIYVGLNFTGSFSMGNTAYMADGKDFLITKRTPAGTTAWTQHYGGAMDQRLWDLAVDKTGVVRAVGIYSGYISVGGTFGNGNGLFVANISASNGLAGSADTFNSAEYGEPRVEVGPDDSWVLTGRCPPSATIGGQTLDPCSNFVAKFDKDDTLQWVVSVAAKPNDVAVGSSGDVLVTADFQNTLTFGGATLTSQGSYDVLVAKLKSVDGSVTWAHSWGGAGDEEFAALSVDGEDRFFLSVNVSGPIDFGGGPLGGAGLNDAFVAAFDPDGNHRYSRAYGDASTQYGLIATRADGGGLLVTVGMSGDIDLGAGIMHSDGAAFAIALLAP